MIRSGDVRKKLIILMIKNSALLGVNKPRCCSQLEPPQILPLYTHPVAPVPERWLKTRKFPSSINSCFFKKGEHLVSFRIFPRILARTHTVVTQSLCYFHSQPHIRETQEISMGRRCLWYTDMLSGVPILKYVLLKHYQVIFSTTKDGVKKTKLCFPLIPNPPME